MKHAPVTQKGKKKFYFIVAEIMETLKYGDTLIKPYFLTAGYALAYFTEMI